MLCAMSSTVLNAGPLLVGALVVMTVLAAAVAAIGQLGHGRHIVVAAVRAAVQLAAVSLVITGIARSMWATTAFVVVMCVIAARPPGGALPWGRRGWWPESPSWPAASPSWVGSWQSVSSRYGVSVSSRSLGFSSGAS
jgi:putative ABC transport system permease protein